MTEQATGTMRAVRFHEYGEPADVLRMDTIAVPHPRPGRICITVHACGLAPADWALCRGLFAGQLPRGIGCDVSGAVDAVGDGVVDVSPGDLVFGTADWANCPSAGAGDHAVMDRWFAVPKGLDLVQAAALPMALRTADLHLAHLGLDANHTILINGAGTTVGFAAAQIAAVRGARLIATAGQTYAPQLEALGATVTPYGPGLVQRVRDISGGPIDLILDTAPVGGALPDLVEIAGDPRHVMTISDFVAAERLGVRDTFREPPIAYDGYEAFAEFAQLAAENRFTVPIARTFALQQWRRALELSLTGHARGKLLLLPRDSAG